MNVENPLKTEEFKKLLNEKFPGMSQCFVKCFSEIDSTNAYAKQICSEKDFHGSHGIILADRQTAGRGRLGRQFYSPDKKGIYLSVIYAPAGGIKSVAQVTAFSAVAVVRAIKSVCNLNCSVKWINDIFIEGKKICGILTEGRLDSQSGRISEAVIGIGINIEETVSDFPDELKKSVGSLKQFMPECQIDSLLLACNVSAAVLEIFNEDPEKVLYEYKGLSFLTGKTVEVHPLIDNPETYYSAEVLDIDEKACLVVKLSDGSIRHLDSGEVSLHSSQFSK